MVAPVLRFISFRGVSGNSFVIAFSDSWTHESFAFLFSKFTSLSREISYVLVP